MKGAFMAYPPEYRRFLGLFAAGHYYEGHDVLEELWRQDRQDFYKGLIQFAVGLYHAGQGNQHGARALLARAERHLGPYRPVYAGLDVDDALRAIQRCRRAVEAGLPLPPVQLSLRDEALAQEGVADQVQRGSVPRCGRP